jgi:hypothetical protein
LRQILWGSSPQLEKLKLTERSLCTSRGKIEKRRGEKRLTLHQEILSKNEIKAACLSLFTLTM